MTDHDAGAMGFRNDDDFQQYLKTHAAVPPVPVQSEQVARPADVPTNGVAAVKTRGKADSASPEPREPVALTDPLAVHRGTGGGLFGTGADDPVDALMQLAYNWTHEPTFRWDNPHAVKLKMALRAALGSLPRRPL